MDGRAKIVIRRVHGMKRGLWSERKDPYDDWKGPHVNEMERAQMVTEEIRDEMKGLWSEWKGLYGD